MATETIALYGSLTGRGIDPGTYEGRDQNWINVFPELITNPLSKAGSVKLHKRNGFTAANMASASYVGIYGTCLWTGQNNALLTWTNSTTIQTWLVGGGQHGGDLANTNFKCRITETTISGVPTLTLVAQKTTPDTRSHAWWSIAGGAWTAIASNYPSELGTPVDTSGAIVHMDGYAFVMGQDGNIYNSDLNTVITWSLTGKIAAQSSPDMGCGLGKSKNLIIAAGTASLEFFQNAGNVTGSPLQRISSASRLIGTTISGQDGAETLISVGDFCYLVGVEAGTGKYGVYQIQGTEVRKISTNYIDRVLTESAFEFSSAGTPCGFSGSAVFGGMTHIIIGSLQLVYCVDTNFWWRLSLGDASFMSGCVGFRGSTYANVVTDNASQGRKLYTASSGGTVGYQDNGSTLTATIQTDALDLGGGKATFFQSAELMCDTQAVSGDINISWSDDDGQTFSTPRTIDPSTGQRRIMRLGSTKRQYSNRRSWKVTETVNRPFRGDKLKLDYTVGET